MAGSPRVCADGWRVERADDPELAQEIVAEVYLPNRVQTASRTRFGMVLAATTLADLTIGRLSYETAIRLTTPETEHFHVNVPINGSVRSRSGTAEPATSRPGSSVVFPPGRTAEVSWTPEATQMCLMVPAPLLEAELSGLIGRRIAAPVTFDFSTTLDTAAGLAFLDGMRMMARAFDREPGLMSHPTARRHLMRILLDGLLLGHRHTFTEALWERTGTGPRGAIARAVDLLEDRPDEPWSSTVLAREVHLSVRRLQEGFKAHVGSPPMAYLRRVRLRRVRDELERSAPDSGLCVGAVAARWGLHHPGRFAAAYRDEYGESPSVTLRRDPTG